MNMWIDSPVFHQHASNIITLWRFPVTCQILKSFCAFVNVYLLTLSPCITSNSKIKQLFYGLILRGKLPSVGSKIELILSKVSSKHILGFPGGSVGKEFACNEGELGLIPRSRRSPGEGNGYCLHYSCLENSRDRGAWWTTIHEVTENRTWLNNINILETSTINNCCFIYQNKCLSKHSFQLIEPKGMRTTFFLKEF